jgi:hypothetical protein
MFEIFFLHNNLKQLLTIYFFPETGKSGALKDINYKISGFRGNAFPEIVSGIDRTKFIPPSERIGLKIFFFLPIAFFFT